MTSSAGLHVQCRATSKTMLVLFFTLAVSSLVDSTRLPDPQVYPSKGEATRGHLALQESRSSTWQTAISQPDSSCKEDAECASHAQCDHGKCNVAPLGSMVGIDILMCFLAFVIAGFSLAAGVGGGGLYVPLLMFVLSFGAREATALSQAMLFGGAFAAFVYNFQMCHPARQARPLINFELALLMA